MVLLTWPAGEVVEEGVLEPPRQLAVINVPPLAFEWLSAFEQLRYSSEMPGPAFKH